MGKTTKKPGNGIPAPNRNVRSMMNNLKSIPDGRYDAARAKFYLKSLREKTGISEQRILVTLLLAGFECEASIDGVREDVRREWMLNPASGKELI